MIRFLLLCYIPIIKCSEPADRLECGMVLIDITYRVCEGEYFVQAAEAFESLTCEVEKIVNCLTDAAAVVFEDILHLLVFVERFLECVDEIINIGSRRNPTWYI